MSADRLGPDDMLARVARFKDLKPNRQAFVDSRLPGHERDIFNVIGTGVNEDPGTRPAIADARDFTLTYVGAEPGKGAALHDHPTVEVFIPISGRWTIYWGAAGEHEIELGPADTMSVPPGVMRGFRNAGGGYAHLMAIIGGADSGRVTWDPKVLARAQESGLEIDAGGDLVERPG